MDSQNRQTRNMIFVGIILSILSTTTLASGEDACRTYNLDIFQLLTRISHREQLEHLNGGPNLDGIDYSEPVYQFDNRRGVTFENAPALGQLMSAICMTKQVTLYGLVVFRSEEDGGAVVEASTMETSMFGLHVYSMFHEIVFVYKHRGVLMTESFQFRMASGRIYKIAVSVDGNLLVLYVDCKEIDRRLILIPDYCFAQEELVVTAGEGNYIQEHRNRSTGFSGTLQSVGIYGGENGLSAQCPNSDGVQCPTCGLHLDRIEEVHRLREKRIALEEELKQCQEDLRTKDCRGNNCIIDGHSFRDGELVVNLDDEICLCVNGNPNCRLFDDLPTIPPTEVINSPPESDDGDNSELPTCPIISGIMVPEGDIGSVKEGDSCRIIECNRVRGSLIPNVTEVECSTYRNSGRNCSADRNRFTNEALICCDICSPCDSFQCNDPNSECRAMGSNPACVCKDGYESSAEQGCIDRDECSLGNQDGGHNCVGNASCINHEGNFSCICPRGQSLYKRITDFYDCRDTDECATEIDDCPFNSTCVNTILGPRDERGYKCICPEGYDLIDNECQPNCTGGCVNGICEAPDVCICLPGFEGSPCTDINECADEALHNCLHNTPFGAQMECKNTMGGYFCACPSGLQLLVRGGQNVCEDIDECASGLHLCPSLATCENTYGGYICQCQGENCVGACDTPGKRFRHAENAIYQCTNCTCNNGDLSCSPLNCDCSEHTGSVCCQECNFNDMCPISNSNPPLNLKIGEMYIDPNDRCTINICVANGAQAVLQQVPKTCAEPSCPGNLSYVPTGACCPVCELPECNADYNGMSVTTSNCAVCTCTDSFWDCSSLEQCDPLDCSPEHIFRSYNQCCPICKQTPITDSSCTAV